jgi:acetylornithine deacetylase
MTLNLGRNAKPEREPDAGVNLEKIWPPLTRSACGARLIEMLDIYSPSGKEEDVQLYLEEQLHGARLCHPSARRWRRSATTFIVPLGWQEPRLYLVGHVDTVGAWDLEELRRTWRGNGLLYGLGSADMKGGCAAMVEAFLALAQCCRPISAPVWGCCWWWAKKKTATAARPFSRAFAHPGW